MSKHEFENYLALVSRLLRLNRSQTDAIRDELFDHLESRIAELTEAGDDLATATRRALEEFGDAASLAQQFQSIFRFNQRRWMMRFATFSIAGTFLVALLVMAMWPAPAHFGSPASTLAQQEIPADADQLAAASTLPAERSAPNRKIWSNEQLDRILLEPAEFDFEEVTFIEVMEFIREKYGPNVLLDQSARDDSLTEDELITFGIREVTLATALRMMLKEKNATYMVHDGVLSFISLDVAGDARNFRRKMFDCRELLEKINHHDPKVGQVIPRVHQGPGGFGGGGGGVGGAGGRGGGVFCTLELLQDAEEKVDQLLHSALGGPEKKSDQPEPLPRVSAEMILADLVRETIEPETWNETNGDGTLVIVGGFMIVVQSQKCLDEIGDLIEELNRRLD